MSCNSRTTTAVGALEEDSKEYITWVEGKKARRVSYPVVTGKGITVTQGQVMPEGKIVPVRKTEEVEV